MKKHCHFLVPLVSLVLVSSASCDEPRERTEHLQVQKVSLQSPDQIILVADPKVKPVLYTNVAGLDKLPVLKAKAKFISAVLPSILVAKYEIDQRKAKVEYIISKMIWSKEDSVYFTDLKTKYRAKDGQDLVKRLESLPTSLVLAQAAIESGWGKSRFFLEANNLFGVWSFNKHESRIPAKYARKERLTYLRSYGDMSESIVHYFEILARSRSYHSLREAQTKTDDPFALLPHLEKFSERRSAYTAQLKRVIVRNNFTQFDDYELDPQYILAD